MSEAVIWSFFKKKGLSDCGAAGLMGNLYAESGLKPDNLQNTCEKKLGLSDADYTAQVDAGIYQDFVHDSAGYGLAQWTFWSRKQKLLVFALSRGKSIGDLEMQLDFLWKELTESYPSLVNILKTAASVRAASDAVLVQFERPADQSEMAKARRAAYGQKYYDQFAGRGETMSSTTMLPAVERVLATARAEIGYIEKETNAQLDHKTANAGDKNWNKYARDLDALGVVYNGRKNGYSWCDIFVDWCHIHTFGLELALKLLCQAKNGVGQDAPVPPTTISRRDGFIPEVRSLVTRSSLRRTAASRSTTLVSWRRCPAGGSTPLRGTPAPRPASWKMAAVSGIRAIPWHTTRSAVTAAPTILSYRRRTTIWIRRNSMRCSAQP